MNNNYNDSESNLNREDQKKIYNSNSDYLDINSTNHLFISNKNKIRKISTNFELNSDKNINDNNYNSDIDDNTHLNS